MRPIARPRGMPTFSENRYRAIWLSDIHLGTRGCKAGFLLDFIRHNDADFTYLLGDIIDGWRLRKNGYWPRQHIDVVQKILRKARKGARVVYVPGNHDCTAEAPSNQRSTNATERTALRTVSITLLVHNHSARTSATKVSFSTWRGT